MTSVRRMFQAAALVVAVAQMLPCAAAQGFLPNLPSSLIDQLNRTAAGNVAVDPDQVLPSPLDQVRGAEPLQPQLLLQRGPGRQPLPRSALEADYSRRAGMALHQYGYEVFRNLQAASGTLQNGAVADNYRLNIGDELVITLEGQVSRSIKTRIDREGRLIVPDLPPIPAAGRSFGAVRKNLEKAVKAAFLNTDVFVSVGAVRQIAVAVLGEAVEPGIYRMGGFATALDALAMAGGVKKTGSLRNIRIVHENGSSEIVDLYRIMSGTGPQPGLSVGDGDRIVIPPIGPTIAVAGEVDRPGIYELASGKAIDGATALALAGAPLQPDGNRYIRFAPDAEGRDLTTATVSAARLVLRPGDMLLVLRRESGAFGSVRLDGHVAVPGIRSLTEAPDLRRLLRSTTLLSNPYLLFGVLITTDNATHARRYLPVDLEAVMDGRQDRRLKAGDTLVVLSLGDINYINSADVQAVLRGGVPPLMRQEIVTRNPRALVPLSAPAVRPRGLESVNAIERASAAEEGADAALAGELRPSAQPIPGEDVPLAGDAGPAQGSGLAPAAAPTPTVAAILAGRRAQICRGLQQLAAIVATNPNRFINARSAELSQAHAGARPMRRVAGPVENVFPCPPIFEQYPELLPLAVEHVAAIEGEVQLPGLYPVVEGEPLAAAVADAGGLALDVDLKRVEITHFAIDNLGGRAVRTRQLLQLTPNDLAKIALNPGDVARFNPVFIDRDSGPVLLSGEFRRPGYYEISHDERLSDLIARAGGLTADAYPYGAVFTRLGVKRREREAFDRAADQLESGLTSALAHGDVGQSHALVAATQQMVNELRSEPAVGRVVVEADPTVLQVKPQLDPIMEPGDEVFMPKRPFYVDVTGEVLNPTALQFRAGATPADYVSEAGGFAQDAEQDRTFVVLPNGEAEPVQISFWNFTPVQVPPGSTIVVPRNLRPFDLTTFLKDSTQIFSQLAISAASLAVLHNSSP